MIAIFCGNLAAGKVSKVNGEVEQTRDYVYVEDVAQTNLLALEGSVPSGAYNIDTGVETSVNKLYETLCDSGRNIAPEHGPAKPGEQLRNSIDPAKFERDMGWYPQTRLASRLEHTLHFFGILR